MLFGIFLGSLAGSHPWGRKTIWDQPTQELPVLLVGATSTAENLVCPIINPNERCSEGSVWKWIRKAQMEPHGTNPHAFVFAKATTCSHWRKPTGGRVGAAEFHMDCFPSASIKQNHSIIKAGKDSQSISQSPWRNKARWRGLAQWKCSSDFNFHVHTKEN